MFHVKFADIGEGIHEGVLLKILVQEDQAIKEGEDLFTIETDKVNAEIPSPTDGVVKTIRFKVGDKVNVGDVIIILDDGKEGVRSNMEGGETIPESKSEVQSESKSEVQSEPQEQSNQPVKVAVKEANGASVVGQIEVSSDLIASSGEGRGSETVQKHMTSRILATPVARKMAKDLGVDIQKVVGTGPQGRVMKADIQTASSGLEPKPSAPHFEVQSPEPVRASHPQVKVEEDRVQRIPMTMLRKTIAQNMTLSKYTIPHTLVMDEADVSDLVTFKAETKAMAEAQEIKLTYLAFFIKAVVLGLKQYDYLNASLDSEKDEIILKKDFNIGIAVDTPDGLMVPVIKSADHMSLFEIAKKIEELTEKARNKTIGFGDLSGGTFTITNYGAVGASFGAPIIKFPEAGILGVGAIVKKPVVVDDEIVIRSILPLSLSFDHRIIDGANAGRFVGYVKMLLANPKLLVML
ncbi:dihydrolipoamide acetyltransferase family protein [Fusibacter sp. 3D3]|uniref:dihydrolipoamide acetyltransferase family protein n=1 Tax=Fusibacter sp. 3D3 TaxID=1048380 RepID=UPI000852D917|nr:dihydrolipoamide acetyltransferase family protein [Fusibacter sp. 3D3]GAU77266.1 dihydrolipoamide acetyltransferase component of pyruvate dehydrogenase complex [Fusibacter sp. 3D3]